MLNEEETRQLIKAYPWVFSFDELSWPVKLVKVVRDFEGDWLVCVRATSPCTKKRTIKRSFYLVQYDDHNPVQNPRNFTASRRKRGHPQLPDELAVFKWIKEENERRRAPQ